MTKKVFVLSGERGGFGAIKTLLRALQKDSRIDLQLVLTDQHLNSHFGATADEVEREFPVSAKVDMDQKVQLF